LSTSKTTSVPTRSASKWPCDRERVRPPSARAAISRAPGYDQLAERRFEFIRLWGFLVFLLYTMRRVDCRRCGVVAVEEVPWGDGKALDEVRAGESRRMASEARTPLLKKSRWLLLKREENLKEEQRFRLRDLLRYNLKTVRAYLLKEAFQQLWEYSSPAWAGKFLDEWCRQTMRSRIEPMKKIARSLRQHRELILNYFRAQKLISSGVVEGLNNKAKVTMRKSYGFRTYRVLELALYHSLGKLPEPESTHDFF
jgi:transposase